MEPVHYIVIFFIFNQTSNNFSGTPCRYKHITIISREIARSKYTWNDLSKVKTYEMEKLPLYSLKLPLKINLSSEGPYFVSVLLRINDCCGQSHLDNVQPFLCLLPLCYHWYTSRQTVKPSGRGSTNPFFTGDVLHPAFLKSVIQ